MPDGNDAMVSIKIFNKGGKLIDKFFAKWQSGEVRPTDEDLDLLEEAFKEASSVYNFFKVAQSRKNFGEIQ